MPAFPTRGHCSYRNKRRSNFGPKLLNWEAYCIEIVVLVVITDTPFVPRCELTRHGYVQHPGTDDQVHI